MKSKFRTLCLLVLPLLLPAIAGAQTHRASVRGTVSDPNGAVIPAATVTVTNIATGGIRTAQTNSNGEYVISSLAPGQYKIEVQSNGFLKYDETIDVLVNQEQRWSVSLRVSGM